MSQDGGQGTRQADSAEGNGEATKERLRRKGENLPPLSPEYAIKVFEPAAAFDGDEPDELDELEEGASPKP